MANLDVTVDANLTNITTPSVSDRVLIVEASTNRLRDITVQALVGAPPSFGWTAGTGTWSYSSADSPTFIVSVNADLTAVVGNGMRVSLQQTQALTGVWSFDSSSTPDLGGFTCTDTNMTYTAGKFSNAATFNGASSKIAITDTANLKPTGEFTIGAWVKTATSDCVIYQSWSSNPNFAGVVLQISGGKATVTVGNNTSAGVGGYTQLVGTSAINNNAFHYVVATWRNNYLQIYVDGALEALGYCVTPAYAATNYVRIGCANNTGADASFINGQIDDLFFINGYALDEQTIRTKYNAGSAQGTGSLTLTKYFIVTRVGAYSGGNTLLTMYGGTDFTLANATISNPYISPGKVPFGFNASPDKWRVYSRLDTNVTQTPPVTNTWYNDGGSVTIPIGSWRVRWDAHVLVDNNGTTMNLIATLSTANNTESDFEFTTTTGIIFPTAAATNRTQQNAGREKTIVLNTKTTYYLNCRTTTGATNIGLYGSASPSTIVAICGYL